MTLPVSTPVAPKQGVTISTGVPAGSLFTASDGDGDAITEYQFWDSGSGGGYFTVSSVQQGANALISAANLGSVEYVGAGVLGSEQLFVRVLAGGQFSEWQSWQMYTLRATNDESVIAAPAVKNAEVNQWVSLSNFISVSDANGDATWRFQLRETGANTASNSGYMYANGAVQLQGASVTVESSTLADTYVRGGAVFGTDTYELRVFDGYEWTDWTSFDLVTRAPNRAPVTTATAATQGVVMGSPVPAGSLFNYADADGDVALTYEFYDNGAGGGNWDVGGVNKAAFTVISVDAAQLGTVTYEAGATAGTEQLYVRAYDGEAWSVWTPWMEQTLRNNNQVSVINAPATKNLLVNQWMALSSFISVADGDADPIVRFELRDMNATPGTSVMYANGAVMAQGVTAAVESSSLAATFVQGAPTVGQSNEFQLRVHDGYAWTDWTSFNVVTRVPNRAPVTTATAATQGVVMGSPVPAGSLFNYTDADGDVALTYEFYDNGAGGGNWDVGGVNKAAFTVISVDAAQLGTVTYEAGATAGTEQLYVRAYDGEAWSVWTPWMEQTLRNNNQVSVINAPATKNLLVNQWMALSSFISVADGDADPIVRFELRDMNATPGTSVMYANGAVMAQGVTAAVESSSLAATFVQGAPTVGQSNEFQLRVHDGYAWTDWTSFNVVTRVPNRAPVTTATAATQGVVMGSPVPAGSLFNYTDADGDVALTYEFYDNGAGGGNWDVGGVNKAAFTVISVDAAQLGTVTYEAGATAGTEQLYVRAYDGEAWSVWTPWMEQTLRNNNQVSVINAPATKNLLVNQWMALSSFISVADGDADPIVRFELRDMNATPGTSVMYANGAVMAQGVTAAVESSSLAATFVQGAPTVGQSNEFQLRVHDGYAWTDWTSFNVVTRVPNRAPVTTATAATQGVVMGSPVPAGSLFNYADADGDVALTYEFYDNGAGGGNWDVGGVNKAAFTVISVDAAQLGTVTYEAGATAGTEQLYVRAYDGEAWSVWTPWMEQTLRNNNQVSVINAPATKNLLVNQWMALSSFISVADGDADPIVRFELRDMNATPGTSVMYANGAVMAQGVTAAVESSSLAATFVQGAPTVGQSNEFQLRVHDGYAWTDWTSFNVVTRVPNRAPVTTATAATQGVVMGSPVPAGSLFNYTDADGDVALTYEFYDNGAGGGNWDVGGVNKAAFTVISVDAAQLGTVTYEAGATAGTEQLYVRAYDGEAWSVWTPWMEQTLRNNNQVSVINAPATKNAEQSQWIALSSFISVTDADADPIVRFEFRETSFNTASNSGYMYANGAVQAQGVTVAVESNTLANTFVRGGTENGTDRYELRVFDGYEWTDWRSFDLVTRLPNRAPVTTATAATQGVVMGSPVLASSLFNYADADGDVALTYEFYDNGAGGGNWDVGGVNKAAFTVISVDAGQLGTVTYEAGATAGTEQLYVRAYDGEAWSVWTPWMEQTLRNNNQVSVINAPATKNAEQSQWIALSSFISVTDADADPILRFEFRETGFNTASNSGYMYANGAVQAQGVTVAVESNTLANTFVRGGTENGTDRYELRVFDGYEWTGWKSFDLVTRLPNRVPVVTPAAAGRYVPAGTAINFADMFSVSDADGDPIVMYELYEGSTVGGGIYRDGVRQSVATALPVAPADLHLYEYVGAGVGVESVFVRAHDGTGWSDWKRWELRSFEPFAEVRLTPNSDSITTTTSSPRAIYFGIGGDDFLNEEHVINDSMWMGGEGDDHYSKGLSSDTVIYENGNSPNDTLTMKFGASVLSAKIDGRHLVLFDSSWEGGVVLIDWTLAANRIEHFHFVSDFLGGHTELNYSYQDMLNLAASAPNLTWEDVDESSEQWAGVIPYYAARELELRANQAPTLAGVSHTPYLKNTQVGLFERFTVADPDKGSAVNPYIQSYEFTDLGAGGGRLLLNGVEQAADTPLVVLTEGAPVFPVYFTAGGPGTPSSTLRVRVFDGGLWSAPLDVVFDTVNQAPSVSISPNGKHIGLTLPVTHFFDVTDDDAAVAQYQFVDAAGGGTLYVSGVAQTPGDTVTVQGADIGTVTYQVGSGPGSESFTVRVNDGLVWSSTSNISFVPTTNVLPVINAPASVNFGLPSTAGGTPERIFALSTELFTFSDANSEPLLFELTDNGVGRGYFEVNGVAQAAQTPIVLTHAQMLATYYVGGGAPGESETFTLRVADAAGWASAPSATVSMVGQLNAAPVVTPTYRMTQANTVVNLPDSSGLFTVSQPDGFQSASAYQVRLSDPTVSFYSNALDYVAVEPGVYQFAGGLHGVYSLTPGAHTVELRASDGIDWSAWSEASFDVVTDQPGGVTAVTLSSTPQTFTDWLGPFDFFDYYDFSLAGAATVNLGVATTPSSPAGYELEIIPQLGGPALYDSGLRTADLSGSAALAAGNYRIVMSSMTNSNRYDLTLSTS